MGLDTHHHIPTPFERDSAAIETDFIDLGDPVLLRHNFTHVGFEVENTDEAVDLTDFQLLAQLAVGGDWHPLITGAGWGSLGALLLYITGRPDTLAATLKSAGMLDVTGLYAIKFQAKTSTLGSAYVRGMCTRNG
jgi:hypothetical protein